MGRVAGELAARHGELVAASQRPASAAEILASEILPLAEVAKFTGRQGPRLLAPKRHSIRQAAWWMGSIGVQQVRHPWGIVLILAPWNYPLLLPGAQALQALAAGNAVIVKPAVGGEAVLRVLAECLTAAAIPSDLFQVLPSDLAAAQCALQGGIDKVLLTGSATTGQLVAGQLAQSLTPSTMELSGCDAVFVLPEADLQLAARSIAYALTLNDGATCIAPRRILVSRPQAETLVQHIVIHLASAPARPLRPAIAEQAKDLMSAALRQGARYASGGLDTQVGELFPPTVLVDVRPEMDIAQADIFAPLTSVLVVDDMRQALQWDAACPYHLGASVFGPLPAAKDFAREVQAGCVTVNDIIVPTADPRVSFGGWGRSGWGVTRGPEGLLEMTRLKVVCTRHGRWRPHLDKQQAEDAVTLSHLLGLLHGRTWRQRWSHLLAIAKQPTQRPARQPVQR